MWFSYMQKLRTVPTLSKSHTQVSNYLRLWSYSSPFQPRIQISANTPHYCEWIPLDDDHCYSLTKKQSNLSKFKSSFTDGCGADQDTFHLSKYAKHTLGEPVLQKQYVAQCTEFSHTQGVATHSQTAFSQTIGVGKKKNPRHYRDPRHLQDC